MLRLRSRNGSAWRRNVDLFGAKFTLTLGAWKLRFVLMLEDVEETFGGASAPLPHHLVVRENQRVR